MKKLLFTLSTALILGLATMSAASAAEIVGTISALKGNAIKQSTNKHEELKIGSPIYLEDHIVTDINSRVKITFIDETEIILGSKSTITIDEYAYNPADDTDNKAHFTLDKSIFHYVSGNIAKKENPDVELGLVYGSIGIRGTKIWRDMMSKDGKKFCRIYIEDGKAIVSNENGSTEMKHGEGVKIHGLENAPTEAEKWSDEAITALKAKASL